MTDAIIGVPRALDASTQAEIKKHLSEAEIAELALGVGCFLGMSKVLINLGMEPESMPVTMLPTPGSIPPS